MPGWNSTTSRIGEPGSCRSREISSRIQIERPWVATIRSSSWIHRSRIEVCGRFNCNESQCCPSSAEVHTAVSVAANSRPLRCGSSRTAFTGGIRGQGPRRSTARSCLHPSCGRRRGAGRRCAGGSRQHRRCSHRSATPSIWVTLLQGGQLWRGHVGPMRSAVGGEPHQAVIGPGPQGVDVARRESERIDHAALTLRSRRMQRADARGKRAGLACQIRTDRLPSRAAVARFCRGGCWRSRACADRAGRT